jgi:hypothetical protein
VNSPPFFACPKIAVQSAINLKNAVMRHKRTDWELLLGLIHHSLSYVISELYFGLETNFTRW